MGVGFLFILCRIVLFFKTFFLMILGFSMLFAGLYLCVHYELRRVDYVSILERVSHQKG